MADRIREGWRECRMADVMIFGNGKERPKTKGIYPIYGGNGILGYCDQFNFQDEIIIIGRVGAYCGSLFYEDKRIWISDNALSARPKGRNDIRFLFYFLKNLKLNQFAEGSSHPLLTQTLLNSIEITIPESESEQRAIASVLGSLDDKIDLLNRENKTLEQMAEAIFRQWFIEEADEEWEDGRLGDEFDFVMGQSPPGSSFNEDAIGVPMFQGNADFGFRFPNERIYTTEPTRFAEPMDVLISVRAPVGAQNMALNRCCIGRGVAAFRYKHNPKYYTYAFFKLRSLLTDIKKFNDEGTVFGSISKNDFENVEIIIPFKSAITKFEEYVKPINDKVIQNCIKIRTLEKLRDTLLPKLMCGEVRII